ncbi:MAG: hypothetical protein WCF44_20625 [Candidatus Methylophosphatis roskildensis]
MPIFYFRAQKEQCEKYPFFELRDEVIWELVHSGESPALSELYSAINSIIHNLNHFDLKFFAKALTFTMHHGLERQYCGSPADWKREREQMHPLMVRCLGLIVATAREHSVLVRLALTKHGSRILMTASVPVVIMRFLKDHPEIFERAKVQRDIAVAGSIINAV